MRPEELREAMVEALNEHSIRERRAQFAAAALTGLLTSGDCCNDEPKAEYLAAQAIRHADAAIAKLDAPKVPKELSPEQIDGLLFELHQTGVRFAGSDTAFHHAAIRKWIAELDKPQP